MKARIVWHDCDKIVSVEDIKDIAESSAMIAEGLIVTMRDGTKHDNVNCVFFEESV